MSGDFARMTAFLKRVPKVVETAAPKVAPALRELQQAGFDAQTDPYGVAWRGLKASTMKRRRGGPLLVVSGTLRASGFSFKARGESIAIGPALHYARFHISTGGRRTLPAKGRLPEAWQMAIRKELEAEIERYRRTL